MAQPSAFLDKLAPDLRLSIYENVLGTSNAIKPSKSTASLGINTTRWPATEQQIVPDEPLHSSVLATSKLIYCEAIQVLYRKRIVRATIPEFSQLLRQKSFVTNVENVEVADYVDGCHRDNSHEVLRKLQRLPRIRSVVILSDCLHASINPSWPVLNFVQHFSPNTARLGQADCVGIGR